MNRVKYANPLLLNNENTLTCEQNVRLYDGDNKTSFEGGELIITTHRLLWGKPGQISMGQTCLALSLSYIVYLEEESPGTFSFSRSRKIVLHLSEALNDGVTGPQGYSPFNFIKLSFREGYQSSVLQILANALAQKVWEQNTSMGVEQEKKAPEVPRIKLRTGIVGIERGLQEKQKAADDSITVAFQDLGKLMGMATNMVKLSSAISAKIKEKQGNITEDETIQFKSYLLSLGIDDPVTRDSYKTNTQYFKSLAKEICNILLEPIQESGGMMSLTDVFCRVNRARGLELISPDDVLNGCKTMGELDLPLKLYEFGSGVMVLHLVELDNERAADDTAALLEEKKSLSCEELAKTLGMSITLAKERLLTTEKYGKCCRDDSIEGLRFYPNLFLLKES